MVCDACNLLLNRSTNSLIISVFEQLCCCVFEENGNKIGFYVHFIIGLVRVVEQEASLMLNSFCCNENGRYENLNLFKIWCQIKKSENQIKYALVFFWKKKIGFHFCLIFSKYFRFGSPPQWSSFLLCMNNTEYKITKIVGVEGGEGVMLHQKSNLGFQFMWKNYLSQTKTHIQQYTLCAAPKMPELVI